MSVAHTPPAHVDVSRSLLRDRLIVTLAAVVTLVGFLWGSGLVGDGSVAEQEDGLFSDAATYIAPDGPAFSIWSVIYLGLLGYVIWQWLPTSRASVLAAQTRLLAAGTILLNGAWLGVVAAQWVTMSVVVIVLLALNLGLVLEVTRTLRETRAFAPIWVGVTFGLYLGWVCIATCANVALWLVSLGFIPSDAIAQGITVGVIGVAVLIALALMLRARWTSFRFGIGAAAAWGLAWIAVGRFSGELQAPPVGWIAAAAAVLVAVGGVLLIAREIVKRRSRATM